MSESDTAPARPQRMTLSRMVEMLATRGTPDHASVTLARNASGDTLVEVTARDESNPDAAAAKAKAVFDALCADYPQRNGHDNAELTLTRNAKGETQIVLEGRTTDATPTVEKLAGKLRQTYDNVRGRYPMQDGMSAKPGSVA